jgi:hypothetical protein
MRCDPKRSPYLVRRATSRGAGSSSRGGGGGGAGAMVGAGGGSVGLVGRASRDGPAAGFAAVFAAGFATVFAAGFATVFAAGRATRAGFAGFPLRDLAFVFPTVAT